MSLCNARFAAIESEALPVLGPFLCLFVPPQDEQKLLHNKGYHIGLYINLNSAKLISDQMPQRSLITPIVFFILCFNSIFKLLHTEAAVVDFWQKQKVV